MTLNFFQDHKITNRSKALRYLGTLLIPCSYRSLVNTLFIYETPQLTMWFAYVCFTCVSEPSPSAPASQALPTNVGIIGDRTHLSPSSDGHTYSRSASPADSDTSGYSTGHSEFNDTALMELMVRVLK